MFRLQGVHPRETQKLSLTTVGSFRDTISEGVFQLTENFSSRIPGNVFQNAHFDLHLSRYLDLFITFLESHMCKNSSLSTNKNPFQVIPPQISFSFLALSPGSRCRIGSASRR